MKKVVVVREVYETRIEVDAENDEQAKELAQNFLAKGYGQDGQVIPDGEFAYVLDKDEWQTYDVE
jgi:hypothetical protein